MDEDRCLGVLFVLSADTWNTTSVEVTLLTTTANQLSRVIRSTRLFQNIQERLAQLSTIHEISMALSSTLDLKQLLALIARNSTQALHAQGCAIRLRDLTGDQFRGQAVSGELIDDRVRDLDARLAVRVLDRTLRDRRPLLIGEPAPDGVALAGLQPAGEYEPGTIISRPSTSWRV